MIRSTILVLLCVSMISSSHIITDLTSNAVQCKITKCSTAALEKNQCMKRTTTGDAVVTELQNCPIHEMCDYTKADLEKKDCEGIISVKYGGETCSRDSDCYGSHNCILFRFCDRKLEGEVCQEHQNCDKGLACKKTTEGDKDGKCVRQISNSNDSCTNDNFCANNMGCHSNGKCVEMFSITNGQEVKSNEFCKSGMTYVKDNKNICTDLTLVDDKVKNPLGFTCAEAQTECTYLNSETKLEEKKNCLCAEFGSTNNRYCPADSTNDRFKKYNNSQFRYDMNAHTFKRGEKFFSITDKDMYFPKYEGADDCVLKEAFNPNKKNSALD